MKTFNSTVYHLFHGHRTPRNLSITRKYTQDMVNWTAKEWANHIKNNKDWGTRIYDSHIVDYSHKQSIHDLTVQVPGLIENGIKILWLTINRELKVLKHFDSFRLTIGKYAQVYTLMHDNPIHVSLNDIISGKNILPNLINNHLTNTTNKYDFIICDAPFAFMSEDWSNIKIPTAFIIEDQHDDIVNLYINLIKKYNFYILNRYKFSKFHTNLPKEIDCQWFPYSVDINTFRDYGTAKSYGILNIGDSLDMGNDIDKIARKFHFYKRINKPQDGKNDMWPVGIEYAKELNKACFTVACDTRYQYPIQKYFEAPACRSIAYGNFSSELEELGFIPNVNMVEVDLTRIDKQVSSFLKHKERLTELYENGMRLIHQKHTMDIRAFELLNWINSKIFLLKGGKV